MTSWTKGLCKTNGINVHYHRTGGNKPPVVLLHGLMLNGACWTALARALEADYDVIMPDARGHGKSSTPEKAYRYHDLAADVNCLIDALELTKPVIIGHSMGGMTAAVVASQNSNRLKGIVLVDPTFLTPQRQREVQESDILNQHLRILNLSKQDFFAEMLARNNGRSTELMELFVEARFQTNIRTFDVLTPPNPDYMHLVKTFDIPSLLVIGDTGSIITFEMASEFAELNPKLQIIQIEKAGHAIPYDQPERFSAVVQTFLRSLGACRLDDSLKSIKEQILRPSFLKKYL